MVWSILGCLCTRKHRHIPEDLWPDILVRLPAEDLRRCKQVCRQWNSLISTSPNFVRQHLNSAVSTLIVVQPETSCNDILFVEDWCAKRRGILRKRTKRFNTVQWTKSSHQKKHLSLSYQGLLLFVQDPTACGENTYTILNPISREQATFSIPHGHICALFFNPFAKGYYTLIWSAKGSRRRFKVSSLSSLLSSSDHQEDYESGWKEHPGVPCLVPWSRLHIVKTDAIYWMGEHCPNRSVIKFDMKNEEFQVIPHPGVQDYERHDQMHLFEKEGVVSFCDLSLNTLGQLSMDVWALQESDMTWSPQRETIVIHDINSCSDVKPLGTLNGELIICWWRRGLFAYHLQLGTTRKLDYDKAESDQTVAIHKKTLLSLKILRHVEKDKEF